MTKRELVVTVADQSGMSQVEVSKVVEEILETITCTLTEGKCGRWELRGFGVFETKLRSARTGRNPRTGQTVPVPERRIVVFRLGKTLKERVAGSPAPHEAHDSTPDA